MELYKYEKLKDIPLTEIVNYTKVRIEKEKVIRDQRYEQVAKLRDLEKKFISEYPNLKILDGISNLQNFVRDFQIKTILT